MEGEPMADLRQIKKYPNRRLYDTAISSYITLADVKALVVDGVGKAWSCGPISNG
jgi:polyhydroxyalkanoate synthesis regulator protein